MYLPAATEPVQTQKDPGVNMCRDPERASSLVEESWTQPRAAHASAANWPELDACGSQAWWWHLHAAAPEGAGGFWQSPTAPCGNSLLSALLSSDGQPYIVLRTEPRWP